MPLLQLNLEPSRKELRWFAGLWWPLICAMIGLAFFRKFHAPTAAVWIWAVGGLLAALGVIAPRVIQPFYLLLMRLTYPVGWCVSHLVLAAMYFLVVTPIGLLLRVFHDPMERRFDRAASTYWTVHESVESGRYFRQL
jgi:hypothetical protein